MKMHTMFVIGRRDTKANTIGVGVHGKGNFGTQPRAKAVAQLLRKVKERG
jgi:hypothetical protein